MYSVVNCINTHQKIYQQDKNLYQMIDRYS